MTDPGYTRADADRYYRVRFGLADNFPISDALRSFPAYRECEEEVRALAGLEPEPDDDSARAA